MSDLYFKARNLPQRVDNAKRRLRELEHEAATLGLRAIKEEIAVVNRAWDREVEIAKAEAEQAGWESSMGVDHAS